MRVLVTGGAGFIGSYYVRTLVARGYTGLEDAQVTVLDKLTYAGKLANLQAVAESRRYDFTHRDICDPTCSRRSSFQACRPSRDSYDASEASPDPKIVHHPLPGRDCRSARYQEDKR